MSEEPEERQSQPDAAPAIERFLGEPTRRLSDWFWLWEGDRPFPIASRRRGLVGRLVVAVKRLLRPLVKLPLHDLWDRQRVFNLILIEHLDRIAQTSERLAELHHHFHQHVLQMQADFQGAIEAHARRLEELDARSAEGLSEVMRHNDALFARVDQKLDRYRREAKELWGRLGALVAAQEAVPPRRAVEVQEEQSYAELERRHRGLEAEIERRVAVYLPYLQGKGEVLDLGCGRGEALAVLAARGVAARGVDASQEMVTRCRDKGLQAERGEIFQHLAGLAEASLGGIVSFHVIEHLPATSLERLARLAWRVLKPGGVLILETPSPLSLVTAARNFWIDPTHLRPVHPASLEVSLREAGFEPVERVDLHPFTDAERLPEIDLAGVAEAERPLADHVNRLRDRIDELLFGYQDYALIGTKP